MRGPRIGGLAALAFAFGGAACGSPTGTNNNTGGTAQVRLMNAAAGSPALDLLVGGTVVLSGVQFEHASPLASVPGGTQTLSVRQSGQVGTLASRSLPVIANAKYTVVVGGSLLSLTMTASMTVDTGLAKPDRANIRLINISNVEPPRDSSQQMPPSVPLDVYITPPAADLAQLTPNLALDARYSSYSSLMYFDPGSWSVRFTNAGTKQVVANSGAIPIAAGEIRAVTLLKKSDGTWQTSVVTEQP
jgi:hypothetical protein